MIPSPDSPGQPCLRSEYTYQGGGARFRVFGAEGEPEGPRKSFIVLLSPEFSLPGSLGIAALETPPRSLRLSDHRSLALRRPRRAGYGARGDCRWRECRAIARSGGEDAGSGRGSAGPAGAASSGEDP